MMIKNYIIITLRNIKKNWLFSSINLVGLSVGLACCLAIYLFVKDEFSFDKFHEKADRIHQVIYTTSNDMELARVPPPISPLMDIFYPEVEYSARLYPRNISVRLGDSGEAEQFEEENVFFADSAIVNIFTFEVLAGKESSFLNSSGTVLLNETLAEKYFPGREALGETIFINGTHPFKVTGVLKDFPSNSHLHFNMLLPYEDMFNLEKGPMAEAMRENLSNNWVISHGYNYVLLKSGSHATSVNDRFDEMVQTYAPEQLRLGQKFRLQPLTDIHLSSSLQIAPEPLGNRQHIYMFSGVAFLTLLIASFNFINLSTAQSFKRSREVGMRKVLGARKGQLFFQFLSESALLSFVASLLAFVMVLGLLPLLNELSGKQLSPTELWDLQVIGGLLGIFLITALLGGTYPAFIIANMKALETIKGKLHVSQNKFSLKRGLVTLQFAITIMLIAGSLLIFRQLNFLQNRPLGFQTQAVITIPILSSSLNNIFGGIDGEMRQRLNVFSEQVKMRSEIKATTISSNIPGLGTTGRYVHVEGKDQEKPEIIHNIQVDYDFIDAYDLKVIEGRDFNREAGTDHISSVIINETAVKAFEWDSPEKAIGKEVDLEGKKAQVIGVVKDFHTTSLRDPIQPLVLDVSVPGFNRLSVITSNERLHETVAFLEEQWSLHFPEKTFEYTFLDTELKELYLAEGRLGKIITVFASLAILVSCMGAFGLMMLTTQQRKKEMGIRKVHGASTLNLIFILLKEFSILLILGFLIGVPVTWWLGDQWLNDFSFKIVLDPLLFVISGVVCLALVWITVSFQAVKTALGNPTHVLKDD